MGDIKIVDFGLARRLGSAGELREILGTPEYVGEVYSVSSIFKSTYLWICVHGLIIAEEFMLNESNVFGHFAFDHISSP